jgi:hypothetical protein
MTYECEWYKLWKRTERNRTGAIGGKDPSIYQILERVLDTSHVKPSVRQNPIEKACILNAATHRRYLKITQDLGASKNVLIS